MGTIGNALKLLSLFDEQTPELGLAELAALTEKDKATLLRWTRELVDHGILEKNFETRRYRLGMNLLRLAHIRETIYPFTAAATGIAQRVMRQTGETCLISLFQDRVLTTSIVVESEHPNRICIKQSEILPIHATAPGLVCLTYMDPAQLKILLAASRKALTPKTPVTVNEIRPMLAAIKEQGYGVSDETYAEGAVGIAVPVFNMAEELRATLSTAIPKSRYNDKVRMENLACLKPAALEIATLLSPG